MKLSRWIREEFYFFFEEKIIKFLDQTNSMNEWYRNGMEKIFRNDQSLKVGKYSVQQNYLVDIMKPFSWRKLLVFSSTMNENESNWWNEFFDNINKYQRNDTETKTDNHQGVMIWLIDWYIDIILNICWLSLMYFI